MVTNERAAVESKTVMPEYIKQRISCPRPTDAWVVLESTPVVSFGDASKARVATLGLNPSRREFNPVARLATDGSSAEVVLEACNTYFSRNPYRQWFDKLSPCVGALGESYSYYNGSACHLDLVQWATDPTWKGLMDQPKRRLIEKDAPFLEKQLSSNKNIKFLLVNGNGAWKQLCEWLPLENPQERIDSIEGHSYHPTQLHSACLFGRLRVLAWSTNLQSSPGVRRTLWEKELPERIKAIAKADPCNAHFRHY
jgi:uracil-DNA glycosylase